MLHVNNFHVSVEDTEILKGLDLTVNAGEVHAIMGPNGSGKSTLAQALAGHSAYEVTDGTATFLGNDLTEMPPEERARMGLFLAFQYPVEIPGISNAYFLQSSLNEVRKSHGLEELDALEFQDLLAEKMDLVNVPMHFADRNVNEGFELVREATGTEPKTIDWRPGARAFFVEAKSEIKEAMKLTANRDKGNFVVEWETLDAKVQTLADELRLPLQELGAVTIDMGRPVGCGPAGKFLVLLPTTDLFTALAACGPSPEDDTQLPEVVSWFRTLYDEFPFRLWGAGRDFVNIQFESSIDKAQAMDLAARIGDFCSDAIDQGAGTKAKLARLIQETGRVYFWWD